MSYFVSNNSPIKITLPMWADVEYFNQGFRQYEFVQAVCVVACLPLLKIFTNKGNPYSYIYDISRISITPHAIGNLIVGFCDSTKLTSGNLTIEHMCNTLNHCGQPINNKPRKIEKAVNTTLNTYQINLCEVTEMEPTEIDIWLLELKKK